MILRGNVFSQSLEMETGLTVFVPNGFRAGQGDYRVVYLLHGLCGSSESWVDNTMLPVYGGKYRAVFVMPEAVRSFYADMAHGQKYFTYIATELPEICRTVLRISTAREDTFIAGVSMGGYGALKCALTYPGQYGACAAISPGPVFWKDFLEELRTPQGYAHWASVWGEQFCIDLQAAFGAAYDWHADNELLELAARTAPAGLPRLYLNCGLQDGLLETCRQLRDALRGLGVPVAWDEWDGAHNWAFFNRALEMSLDFCWKRRR